MNVLCEHMYWCELVIVSVNECKLVCEISICEHVSVCVCECVNVYMRA